jgi:hypothetical protein
MVFTAVRSEGCHLNSGIERVVAMAAALGCSEAKKRDMSSTQVKSETAIETPRARTVDMKLEVVVIPVSDVVRAQRRPPKNERLNLSAGGRVPRPNITPGAVMLTVLGIWLIINLSSVVWMW